MRVGVALSVLFLMLSGCGDPSPETTGEGDAGANVEPVQQPPEPTYRTFEVYNDTLAFPRNGGGENDRESVVVDDGDRNITLRVWRRVECPLTTYREPVVVLTAPDGQSTTTDVFPEAAMAEAYTCPFVEPADEEVAHHPVPGGMGTWSVETVGDCTCTVRAALTVERPR